MLVKKERHRLHQPTYSKGVNAFLFCSNDSEKKPLTMYFGFGDPHIAHKIPYWLIVGDEAIMII